MQRVDWISYRYLIWTTKLKVGHSSINSTLYILYSHTEVLMKLVVKACVLISSLWLRFDSCNIQLSDYNFTSVTCEKSASSLTLPNKAENKFQTVPDKVLARYQLIGAKQTVRQKNSYAGEVPFRTGQCLWPAAYFQACYQTPLVLTRWFGFLL
jgi:hypothetical protein